MMHKNWLALLRLGNAKGQGGEGSDHDNLRSIPENDSQYRMMLGWGRRIQSLLL